MRRRAQESRRRQKERKRERDNGRRVQNKEEEGKTQKLKLKKGTGRKKRKIDRREKSRKLIRSRHVSFFTCSQVKISYHVIIFHILSFFGMSLSFSHLLSSRIILDRKKHIRSFLMSKEKKEQELLESRKGSQ